LAAYLYASSSLVELYTQSTRALAFSTNGTERMRIDSSGNLLVGRTSTIGTNCRLNVQLTGTSASGYTAAGNAAIAIDCGTGTNGVINLVGGGDIGVYRANSSSAYDVGISFGSNADRILRFDTAGSERMRIDSSGNLLVGTTTSGYRLNVEGTSTVLSNFFKSNGTSTTRVANQIIRIASNASGADTSINFTDNVTYNYWFGGNNGGAYVVAGTNGVRLSNGGTSWASDSDESLKDIIEPITDATNKVSTLRAVIGKYKTDAEGTRRSFLIAQDVQDVLPEAVFDEQGTLMLAYTEVIPLLVAAIKEQQAIINNLKARIETLESK
jgi:hypothetical protein